MKKAIIAISILVLIILLPFILFALHFISASFYDRQDLTALATKLNVPILCYLAPPTDHCEESFPCAKPELCFNDVAINNKNPKACDFISIGGSSADKTGIDFRNQCYVLSGMDLREASKKCLDISEKDSWIRGDCFGFFAAKLNNISICQNNAYDDVLKAQCFLTFVRNVSNPNPDVCIQSTNYKAHADDCYVLLAWNTKDLSICKKISKADLAKFCMDEILND
ncbi:MAG: hypothetical protein AAB352_01655 [Patescibacteria group bacterium]